MGHRVCPWWLGYFLISPLRRWHQGDPARILEGYCPPGMTVLEPGPGMGFFTLPLLSMAGKSGRVVAVDIQPKMIARLKRRAEKAGLIDRLDARIASPASMELSDLIGAVDFTLAFAVVHEFPDPGQFFQQVASASKAGSTLLLAEPKGHVSSAELQRELDAAAQNGFQIQSRPSIPGCHAVLLQKSQS